MKAERLTALAAAAGAFALLTFVGALLFRQYLRPPPAVPQLRHLTLLWASDMHVSPFYNASLGPPCMCMDYRPYGCEHGADDGLFPYPFDRGACAAASAGGAWGQPSCDPPAALAYDAMRDMARAFPDAHAVLVTGDWVGHEVCLMPTDEPVGEALRVLGALSGRLAKTLGGARVVHAHPLLASHALGNEDVVPDYFEPGVSDGPRARPLPYLEAVASVLQPALPEAERARFVRGGGVRYELLPGRGGLELLALNTLIYSPEHRSRFQSGAAAGAAAPAPADPFGQLAWLDAELGRIGREGKTALVCGHIPPAVDHWSFRLEWEPVYAERYLRVLARHGSTVGAQLFGHVHQDLYRGWPRAPPGAGGEGAEAWPSDGPPMLVTGALSPGFGNRPVYRALSLEEAPPAESGGAEPAEPAEWRPRWRPSDFRVRAATLQPEVGPAWRELYAAQQRYAPFDVLTSAGLRRFAAALLSNETLWRMYSVDRFGGVVPKPPGRSRPPGTSEPDFRVRVACGVTDGMSTAAFDACIARHAAEADEAKARSTPPAAAPAGAAAADDAATASAPLPPAAIGGMPVPRAGSRPIGRTWHWSK